MIQFLRQNWPYLFGALLLHVLFAGVFGLTLIRMSSDAPPPQLAIQAVIVDESMLAAAPRTPPRDVERERRLERERAEAQRREKELAEQRRLEEEVVRRETEQRAEQERQAEQRRREEEEQRRLVEERQLRERQEEQRRREAETEKQRQAEAERKRVEEIKRKQDEDAKKRRAAEEAKAQAAREAELQRQLEDEEATMTARGSSAMQQYMALIQQHVERRWTRPPSAREGVDCVVKVVQAPGGSVLSAEVTQCNGDAAVRQSIETAVLRASPLPPPPDPRVFDRVLLLRFRPQ